MEHTHGSADTHPDNRNAEADDRDAEEFWNDLYLSRASVWSGRVNPVLATEVEDLTPGTALDLGCGEGGDAVWLAAHGWFVTATDIAQTAIDRAMAHADQAGVADRIDWQRHDFSQSFPEGAFDLVSAQFLQSPIEFPRADVLRLAAAAVAPGGTLIAVSHAAFPPWAKGHNPDHDFPTPDEELALLDLDPKTWTVLRCEVAQREGTGPDGQAGTLFDSILIARRAADVDVEG